ncbi:MAG: ABC transporter permease [Pirellulales bacterium]|jgi:peptide/nickel transport system permease protein
MNSPSTNSISPDASQVGPAKSQSATKSRGYWSETWIRFRRRYFASLALVYVSLLALVSIFSPALAGTKPVVCRYKGQLYFPALGYFNSKWENPIFMKDRFYKIYPKNLKKKDPESWAVWPVLYLDPYRRVKDGEWENRPGDDVYEPPSWQNPFGTNHAGVDVMAQMIHGTQIALLVGFVSTGIAAIIGVILGAVAGYLGGVADMLVSRVIEVVMCVPALVLILTLLAILEKPTIWHMMAVLGITGWTGIARLTRGEFLKLRQAEFVTAARALGVRWPRIVFRHILPNAMAPVLVPISFGIAAAILTESGLSLLGFGAPPPNPSWGTLLNSGKQNLQMWWLILFPGIAIFLTVLSYNLIGEGLQEATDPRLREAGK